MNEARVYSITTVISDISLRVRNCQPYKDYGELIPVHLLVFTI